MANGDQLTGHNSIAVPSLLLDNTAAAQRLVELGTSEYLLGYQPAGSRYDDLLNLSLRYCSYGLLVKQHQFKWTDDAAAALTTLKPWLLHQALGAEWPGTRISGVADLLVYRYDADFVNAASSLTRRLYEWEQPDRPEDLCLFRPTGEPWLGSIAHEHSSWVQLKEDEVSAVQDALAPLPLRKYQPPKDSQIP